MNAADVTVGDEVWVCRDGRAPYVAVVDRVSGGPTFFWANVTPLRPTLQRRIVRLSDLRLIADGPVGAER